MLVAPCPRCHESVRVPDAILQAADSSTQAQCPWCLATIGGDELQAALPPAMVVVGVGEEALSSGPGLLEQPAVLATAAMGAAAGVAGIAGAGLASAASLGDSQSLGALDDTQPDAHEFASMETVGDQDGGFIEANIDAGELEELSEMDVSFEGADEDLDPVGVATTQFDGLATEQIDANEHVEFEPNELAATELLSIQPSDMEDVPDELMIKETEVISGSMMDVEMVRRRSRKGGGLKTAISVVLGGLVALPIVGGILLAAGKAPKLGFWPFDGSFNAGAAQRTASAPAPQNELPDPVASPPQGRSLAEDLGPPETFETDPAAAALSETDKH